MAEAAPDNANPLNQPGEETVEEALGLDDEGLNVDTINKLVDGAGATPAATAAADAPGEGEGEGGEADAGKAADDAPADAADGGEGDGAAGAEGEGEGEGEAEAGGEAGAPADDADTTATPGTQAAKQPTPPAQTQPDPAEQQRLQQQQEARQQRAARITEINKKVAEYRALKPEERDPFALAELLAEKDGLRDEELAETQRVVAAAQQTAAEDHFWSEFATNFPEVGSRGRAMWDEEVARARTAYPGYPPAAHQLLATDKFKARVDLIQAQHKSRAEKAKLAGKDTPAPRSGARAPTVTPGGAKVTPAQKGARPPQPKPKTVDDKLEAGQYGDLSKIA